MRTLPLNTEHSCRKLIQLLPVVISHQHSLCNVYIKFVHELFACVYLLIVKLSWCGCVKLHGISVFNSLFNCCLMFNAFKMFPTLFQIVCIHDKLNIIIYYSISTKDTEQCTYKYIGNSVDFHRNTCNHFK